ncbi:endonuclease/exonuclease/phosphatase family protein [Roseomonas sp. OT10]|nr:endonuclease/exonuclease/phosphatase family protein [Roseomonas sp. OT10]
MTNREAPALLALARSQRPDVLVLLETDSWWDGQLAALDADFPHALKRPLENTYGLHVFSRLPMRDAALRRLVEEDVPSARMQVRLPGGHWVSFHALHPRPPVPGQDSEPRDAELLLVGREMKAAPHPAVVAGDMNDVAWSSTTRLFQRISGTLDPRIGRGAYATFNAHWPLLRWPLDHVFATPEFTLAELRVLPAIGSDHFPILAELCYRPAAAARQAPAPATPGDQERASETIRDGREEVR